MIDRQSRWSELRLIVQRPISSSAEFAVLVRRVEGGVRRDKLLCRGAFHVEPGSPESLFAHRALAAAVTVLVARTEGRWDGPTPARRDGSAPPSGGHGGDTLPGLDRAATLGHEEPPPL